MVKITYRENLGITIFLYISFALCHVWIAVGDAMSIQDPENFKSQKERIPVKMQNTQKASEFITPFVTSVTENDEPEVIWNKFLFQKNYEMVSGLLNAGSFEKYARNVSLTRENAENPISTNLVSDQTSSSESKIRPSNCQTEERVVLLDERGNMYKYRPSSFLVHRCSGWCISNLSPCKPDEVSFWRIKVSVYKYRHQDREFIYWRDFYYDLEQHRTCSCGNK